VTSTSNQPLAGIRVLEFGQYAAGPFASLLLADWGADVVKVEPPDGDGLRAWPPFASGADDASAYSFSFAAMNRNKRSVVIDLKTGAGRERALKLASKADLVVENLRPGVMDNLGLGYEVMRELNPALVYCSISGYGQAGPFAGLGAFDVAIQGISGVMSVTGEEDGPPAKCGVPIADFASGTFAALSCMVALRSAEQTGKGCQVDVSMLSCVLAMSGLQTSELWGTGVPPRRRGSAHPQNAPYQAFQGADGKWFIVAAGNNRLWEKVCDVIDSPALADDARFTLHHERSRNQGELAEALKPVFARRPAAEWLKAFQRAGVPCAPVYDYSEVLATEHVRRSGLLAEVELPNGARIPAIANPVRMSGYNFSVFQRPPTRGEHDSVVDAQWLRSTHAA
jgi:succinate---hydroxymethylglutarate CoA-transferase